MYELTVRGPPGFSRAMAGEGFRVVDHEPYKGQLAAILTREGGQQVATLRSDGWFVDEAVGSSPEEVARTLAVSMPGTARIWGRCSGSYHSLNSSSIAEVGSMIAIRSALWVIATFPLLTLFCVRLECSFKNDFARAPH